MNARQPRRSFLRCAGGLLGSAALAGCGDGDDETRLRDRGDWPPGDRVGPERALTEATLSFFGGESLASAGALGAAYEQSVGESASEDALVDLQLSLSSAASTADHLRTLQRRVTNDFEHERVLVFGGWYFSRTELLLAAWAGRLGAGAPAP